jgi:hypothetical protein
MFKWVLRSGFVGVLILVAAGTALSDFTRGDVDKFNWSDVNSTIRGGADAAIRAGQIRGDDIDVATGTSSAKGNGFYEAIYADTVRNPNKLAEKKIKERFGIRFKVDLAPASRQGQFLFYDFFKNPGGALSNPVVPTLQDTLQSDCVRIRSAQADDEVRRWNMVKRRIQEQQKAAESGSGETTNREILLRLGNTIDDVAKAQVANALANVPELKSLNSQDILLKCYQDISSAVDFEFRLQSILNPSRKHLEALQTFMNGRLDDFTQSIPLTDISYGTSFPQYDLLFDIDVIDLLFFGTPVATTSGVASGGSADPSGGNSRPFTDYAAIQAVTSSEPGDGGSTTSESPGVPSPNTSSTGVNSPSQDGSSDDSTSSTSAFGSSSNQFAGPMCTELETGLDLDYTELDAVASGATGVITTPPTPTPQAPPVSVPPSSSPLPSNGGPLSIPPGEVLTQEGTYNLGLNRQALCEGTLGINFGNDMLQLLFCIDIKFSKLGKTWQSTPQENCIACHLTAMNQVFEEIIFKSSVRPHKNTGTIMESGICEDGYGDDLGFFSFIEFVPVKLYPELCYPKGGVTPTQYAELVGYPELLARVNKPGFEVQCDVHFIDEDAVKRCKEAVGGNTLNYYQFQEHYLESINLETPMTSVGEGDRGNTWVRLVGDQGVVERELHLFLYRLGQAQEQYGESVKVPQDFKAQYDYLRGQLDRIQKSDLSEERKLEQLMCLKGSFYGGQVSGENAFECEQYEYTYRQVDEAVSRERDRISGLTAGWNARSRDFNQENQCDTFSGSGIVDAFKEEFKGRFSFDYFLETDVRRAQSPAEQITRQVTDNSDIDDLNRLFSEINSQLDSVAQGKTQEQLRAEFQSSQESSLLYYSAFAVELGTFRSILKSYSDWWDKMLTDQQFISKGGQRISVMESFLEKLR